MRTLFLSFASAACMFTASFAYADDYTVTLQHHQFTPNSIVLPAHQQVKLKVINLQNSPAEFESEDLGREKLVSANGSITLLFSSLKPGTYTYFDDFHRDTTGTIIVK